MPKLHLWPDVHCRVVFPIASAIERFLPSLAAMIRLVRALRWLEHAVHLPRAGNIIAILPESSGEPRQVRRTERCRLDNFRTHNRHLKNISLELHQEIVGTCAAIDAALIHRNSRILFHYFENIAYLKCNAFQRGSRDMARSRSACQPGDRTARILIPMRCTQPRKRGHEIYTAT